MNSTTIRYCKAISFALLLHLSSVPVSSSPNLPSTTLSADFTMPLGTFKHSPGRALSATPGRSGMNDVTWQKLGALNLEQVRLWLMFSTLYNLDTKAADLGSPIMGGYFTKYSAKTQKLLVCLDFGRYYYQLVETSKWTESEYLQAYTNVLESFKQRFPKMEYMEIDNEPNAAGWSVAKYYKTYSLVCSIIAKVNAKIATGSLPGPQLKVGGPTLYKLDSTEAQRWITPFLDAYTTDTSANKRLDFITYHQYLSREFPATQPGDTFKDWPARIGGDRALIDAALQVHGLPALPVMVTEGGIYGGSQPTPTPSGDFFIKAAAQLAMDYYFLEQPNIVPYRWTVDGIEPVKALFVLDSAGKSTGGTRPFYHATAFQVALPAMRFSAETDLDARGMGIGTLAGGSDSKVSVLLWNYQWKNSISKDFNLKFVNLPAGFGSKPVLVKVQAVRQPRDTGDPVLEVNDTIAPTTTFSCPLHLGPNEFALVELFTQQNTNVSMYSKTDKKMSNGLYIYQNNVKKDIFVIDDKLKYGKVDIFNLAGKQIYTRELDGSRSLHIPPSLSTGIYIVKFSR